MQAPDKVNKTPKNLPSKCYSPRLKKNIGYAFIPIDYAKNDTEFTINSPYANLKTKVVPLPFYDPKKQIPIK